MELPQGCPGGGAVSHLLQSPEASLLSHSLQPRLRTMPPAPPCSPPPGGRPSLRESPVSDQPLVPSAWPAGVGPAGQRGTWGYEHRLWGQALLCYSPGC